MIKQNEVKKYSLPVSFHTNDFYAYGSCKSFDLKSNRIYGYNSLYCAFSDFINDNLYYSFNINGSHSHEHSFEDVIANLYNYPNTFNIDDSDLELYSKQELRYLDSLQYYLKFLKLADLNDRNKLTRLNTTRIKKYSKYNFYFDKFANKILEGKINYGFSSYYGDTKTCILAEITNDYKGLVKLSYKELDFNDLNDKYLEYMQKGFSSKEAYIENLKDIANNNKIILVSYEIIEKF